MGEFSLVFGRVLVWEGKKTRLFPSRNSLGGVLLLRLGVFFFYLGRALSGVFCYCFWRALTRGCSVTAVGEFLGVCSATFLGHCYWRRARSTRLCYHVGVFRGDPTPRAAPGAPPTVFCPGLLALPRNAPLTRPAFLNERARQLSSATPPPITRRRFWGLA